MLKSKFNEQMNNALNDYKNRILALADSQQKLVMVDFTSPEGLALLSSVSAELKLLTPGVYVGLATGTQMGIVDANVDVATVVVATKGTDLVITKTWGALWYQVRNPVDLVASPWVKQLIPADLSVIQNKLLVLTAEIRNSGILAAIDLDIENPKLIQPTPTASEHSKMGSGLVYFSAMAGELSIPTNLIAADVTSVLASIFVLNVPERTYYYTAYHGQKVYVSTIVPSVNLTHNWKAAGGTDQTAVEELIRGLIATSIQAVDKTNNTSLMSPKAFSVAFDAALADWVGAAPEALDTIVEIAAAFQNNPDILNVMMGLINELRTDTDQLKLDMETVQTAVSQFSTSLNNLSTAVTELDDRVDLVSSSVTALTERVVVLETAEPGGGTASGFSIQFLDMAIAGQNLFNNADIKTIDLGLYAVELVEADLANFDGALTNVSTLPLLASVMVAEDDMHLGERIVQWTVSDGVVTIKRTYHTLTSTGVNVELVSATQLVANTNETYLGLENSINRVGYLPGGVVTAFTGKIVKGGPIADGSTESRIKVQFTPAGEILATSPNALIQADLNELANYWLPYGAIASEYSFKYVLGSGSLDAANTTMSVAYVVMGVAAFSVAAKATDGNSVSSTLTVYVKHNPTGTEKMISFTLQANGNYFN